MGMKKVEIVSHRGANGVAPENTLAAAQACIDLGVDYVEVDVWTSRDGLFYVMHDATVDRTTDGSGHLLALTAAEIDQTRRRKLVFAPIPRRARTALG